MYIDIYYVLTLYISQFVQYMRNQQDSDPLYVFDSGFGERIPQLLKEYKIPKHFYQDLFSVLEDKRPSYRWILIGPMRSGAPFHIDPNGTSAWNALLHGRKRWALYPPHFTPPGVKFEIDENGIIKNIKSPTPMKWFFEIYPTLPPEQKPMEFTLQPNEMIDIYSSGLVALCFKS